MPPSYPEWSILGVLLGFLVLPMWMGIWWVSTKIMDHLSYTLGFAFLVAGVPVATYWAAQGIAYVIVGP